MRSPAFLIALASAGCVVTQAPTMAQRPRWYIEGDARFESACVHGLALLRKSGKQGVGFTLELKSTSDCTVALGPVRVVWPDGSSTATVGLPSIELRGHSLAYAWVPVPFDNNAAWNAGRDSARVELDVVVAGTAGRWSIPMRQR